MLEYLIRPRQKEIFLNDIIASSGLAVLPSKVREQLISDLGDALDNDLRRVIAMNLSVIEATQLEQMTVDQAKVSQVQLFLLNHIPHISSLAEEVLSNFRRHYVSSASD
ncbi:MAG: hypothetical protein KDD42_05975 [Bdellovibrionales bacterium]|nr:hypothetical protein [Bdellovibrionales bacterium]